MAGTFFIHCGVVKSIQSFIYNRSIKGNCIADLIKLASEKKNIYIYIVCQAHVYLHLVTYG